MATTATDTLDTESLQALLGPQLTAEHAALIFQQGQEAVVFCAVDPGQATDREVGPCADGHRPVGTFGSNPALCQAVRQGAGQSQRGQAGTSRSASATADADRPPRGTHARGLSQVSGAGATLPWFADPRHRGHPRRHHAGGHRTHDPSLLVPTVSHRRRTDGPRRLARLLDRPAGRGPLGVAALLAGHDTGPDPRRVQLPPPVQAVFRRPDRDVAAVAGDPPGLGSRNPDPGPPKRRVARRRDRLAGQRRDLLVVVFRVEGRHVLHDRPAAWPSGVEAVLQGRVRRGVGDRLLGAYNAVVCAGNRSACRTCCAT